MSALNITCAGAVYHGCSTLEIMKYRCPQWQPGSDLPVNAAPEESEEATEDNSETEQAGSEEPASDDSSNDEE